jgi:hypothetical protein
MSTVRYSSSVPTGVYWKARLLKQITIDASAMCLR